MQIIGKIMISNMQAKKLISILIMTLAFFNLQIAEACTRVEGSLVHVSNQESGLGFGSYDTKSAQYRVMLEVGLLF